MKNVKYQQLKQGGKSTLASLQRLANSYFRQFSRFVVKLRLFDALAVFANLCLNILALLKNLTYNYPLKKVHKSFSKAANAENKKTLHAAGIRIVAAIAGALLLVLLGEVIFPGLGNMLFNSLYFLVQICKLGIFTSGFLTTVSLLLAGSFTGTFISKQATRLYFHLKYNFTNPAYILDPKKLKFLANNPQNVSAEKIKAYHAYLIKKMRAQRVLGNVSPMRSIKYQQYKSIMKKLLNGQLEDVVDFFEAKSEAKQTKLDKLKIRIADEFNITESEVEQSDQLAPELPESYFYKSELPKMKGHPDNSSPSFVSKLDQHSYSKNMSSFWRKANSLKQFKQEFSSDEPQMSGLVI